MLSHLNIYEYIKIGGNLYYISLSMKQLKRGTKTR